MMMDNGNCLTYSRYNTILKLLHIMSRADQLHNMAAISVRNNKLL